MAYFYCFPNQAGGWNPQSNELVIPANSVVKLYLIAGADLSVKSDGNLLSIVTGQNDDKDAHKKTGLNAWEKSQNIRMVTIRTGGAVGSCKLTAVDDQGHDWLKPASVYVVNDMYGRRVGTNGTIEENMRRDLNQLSLRQAVIRIARDQISSRVKSNAEGRVLYNLPSNYNGLWCGAFAYWCWEQAAKAKGANNPFGNSNESLLSPLKAIDWAMQLDTPVQLLQYGGFNPLTMKAQQPLRENGWSGNFVSPGDIALWRDTHATDFKHVSIVASVNGDQFTDVNGNAYDAGSGSALAEISHDNMKKKLSDRSYKCFFAHVVS